MAPPQTRSKSLPENPSAEHLRKEAKRLARGKAIQLAAAQLTLAREYGYRNWSELIRHVKSLSAAYKAASKPDDATGAAFQPFAKARTDFEARFVAAALARAGGNMAEADLPLGVNLVDKPALTEGPDLMQLRLHIVDESRDRPEMLELLEKLEIPRATALELEKDLPFLPLRDLIAFPRMVYPVRDCRFLLNFRPS